MLSKNLLLYRMKIAADAANEYPVDFRRQDLRMQDRAAARVPKRRAMENILCISLTI